MPVRTVTGLTPNLARMAARMELDAANVDAASAPRMFIDPATYYDAAYWTGRKRYRVSDGRGGWKLENYNNPARDWHGFGHVVTGMLGAFGHWRPTSALDIGCGSGSFVSYMVKAGIDAYGADVSDDALAHPVREAAGRILKHDISQGPPRVTIHAPPGTPGLQTWERWKFDLLTATDLLEHIYERDIDAVLRDMVRCVRPGGLLFFDVATVAHERDRFVHPDETTPIPFEWEGTAVAGHVNVRTHDYWTDKMTAHGLRVRWDVQHRWSMFWAEHPEMSKVVSWGPRWVVCAEVPT